MSTDGNVFRKGEWIGGRFVPYATQGEMHSTEAEQAARQQQASGWQPSDDGGPDGMPLQPPRGPGLSADDLELLRLAARALGAVRIEEVEGEQWVNLHFADGSTAWNWNPLLHSDDTFNLQVRLRMFVEVYDDSTEVYFGEGGHVDQGFTGTDEYAATKRAVTRAAAEIGKAMA